MKKKGILTIIAIITILFSAGMSYAQTDQGFDVTVYGTTMPFTRSVISTKVPGTVEFVPDIEGIKVKSGEVIIKLNKKDFELSANVLGKQVKLAEISSSHAAAECRRILDLYNKNATSAQTKDNAVFSKDSAYASLELTKANRDIAEKALADTTVTAPFDGIISKKYLNVNEFIDKGKPVVEIVNIDNIKACFKVPEKFINNIKNGDKIIVSLEHCPGKTFDGEVYSINPVGDSVNHSFEIIAAVKNTDHVIKAGMFVKGVLTFKDESNVKAISQNINSVKKSGEKNN